MTVAVAPIAPIARAARRRANPPAPPDSVTGYALDVVAGRIVAGALVRKAAERHLTDLATGLQRGLRFDVAAAERAIAFFPGVLRHYKGEWGPLPGIRREGLPITLEGWQKFIIGAAFGWKRADGTRRFHEIYLEVAKKNGKTTIAAGVALLLAFFDGEPGAEVYAIATKREQAKLVWNDAKQMVAKSAGLSRRIATYVLSLTDESSASFFRPLGRDSGEAEQGINAHGGVVDELHVIEDAESIDNLETSMSARRQPMLWKITTAGKKKANSVWANERADAVAVVEGRATDDSMLVLIYTLDEGDDVFDEAVWPKANPNLGVSVSIDFLREQAAKAARSPAKRAAFEQLRMNKPTGVSIKAIDIDLWDSRTGLQLDEETGELENYDEWVARVAPKGALGYGGLDLASVRDLTADIDVFRADGEVNAVARFYCPLAGILERSRRDGVPYQQWVDEGWLIATPGETTDYAFIREKRLQAAKQWEISEIGYDKWNATQLATELEQDGATMVAIPQTHAGLGPGWRELEKLLFEDKLHHGGHPILRWMAGNVEVELDAQGNAKPSKSKSTERIDGMVGLNMAIARMIAHPEADIEPWVIVR